MLLMIDCTGLATFCVLEMWQTVLDVFHHTYILRSLIRSTHFFPWREKALHFYDQLLDSAHSQFCAQTKKSNFPEFT